MKLFHFIHNVAVEERLSDGLIDVLDFFGNLGGGGSGGGGGHFFGVGVANSAVGGWSGVSAMVVQMTVL